MTFDELREKYSSISFDLYEYIEDERNITIYFYYSMGEFNFKHTLVIPKKKFFVIKNFSEKNFFFFNLGFLGIFNFLFVMVGLVEFFDFLISCLNYQSKSPLFS